MVWFLVLVVTLGVGMGACSPPAEGPAAGLAPAQPVSAMPAAGTPADTAAAPSSTVAALAGPAETVPAPAAAEGLPGTTWRVGDFVLTFQNGKDVLVKGKPVENIAPDGLTAAYTLDQKVIEISALGKTYSGTWDGSNLVIDGQVGARQ